MIVICPQGQNEKEDEKRYRRIQNHILEFCKKETEYQLIRTANELEEQINKEGLKHKRLLFLVELGEDGINLELYAMLQIVRGETRKYIPRVWKDGIFENSVGAVIVEGQSEFYTKAIGREIVQTANLAGCSFPGRSLIEGTGSLKNHLINAKNMGCSTEAAYIKSCEDLVKRLLKFSPVKEKNKKLLCIHACDPPSSNTYWLWKQLKSYFSSEIQITEISMRDAPVMDCAGCSYETCMYFSQNSECFYGGTMTEEIYPALEECSALILLCPNYNDAIGANLMAFINRLTSLYRKKPFEDKYLFAVVVSGYSGTDLVLNQLIGALNMNKAFLLPANFALTETANLPGSVAGIPGILEKTERYAKHIMSIFDL